MTDGLLPKAPPCGRIQADRELPQEARAFGRILDLSGLEPGDLILTRPVDPNSDRISRSIMEAQERGGFHRRHAQWTHAAVYLGDGEHICEANFKLPDMRDGVVLRSAFHYCDGTYALRARRPRNMTPQQRIRIAIGALTSIGKSYNFIQVLQFAHAAWTGQGFWASTPRGPRISPRALVCSTLYQDAYNFAFLGTTVRMGALCTPAHLSASPDFEPDDPPLGWLEIA